MKARVGVAVAIGVAAGGLCLWTRTHVTGFTDFDQIWLAGRSLARASDPYVLSIRNQWPFLYPLPAAIVGLPFAMLSVSIAAALWTTIGFGLLAFGLGRDDWWRLIALCSLPAVESAQLAQWSPIITAAFLLPALNFLAVAKPTTAAPVALSGFPDSTNRIALGVALGLFVLSFAFRPGWVAEWVHTVRSVHHFRPFVVRPFGFVLLLALVRWRRREAWLVALVALMPQAGMAYDALPLAVVPLSRRESLAYAVCTFACVPFRHVAIGSGASFTTATAANAPLYLVALYMPAMLMVLTRPNRRENSATSEPTA